MHDTAPMAIDPDHYFELTMDELREVARFAVQGAQAVLAVYEDAEPGDPRPRAAIQAASAFANGARRTKLQRVTALDAHRAAKAASSEAAKHAAHAAGDAASAAYLHPFAHADQLGHILRADAHAAYAEELLSGDPAPAPAGSSRVAILMKVLDDMLRTR